MTVPHSLPDAAYTFAEGLPASGMFPCTFEMTHSQVGAMSWSGLIVSIGLIFMSAAKVGSCKSAEVLLLLSGGQCPCLSMFDLC